MKKTILKIMSLALLIGIIFSFASCELVSPAYKVTFKAEGKEDVIIYVEPGAEIPEDKIPELEPTAGYTSRWSVTDFSNITGDMEVVEVKVPLEYTIYYDMGDAEGDATLSTQVASVLVTYGEEFTLIAPTCDGFEFKGWKEESSGTMFEAGVYSNAGDTYLVAVWEIDETDDGWWTPEA